MKADPTEEKSPILASLAALVAAVAAWGGLGIHTLLSRRRYRRLLDEADPTWATDLFLETPGALYAAVLLLLITALLVKECAIERKQVTLRINLAALGGALLLLALFFARVQIPFERLRS